jgi:hypothetical protein
MYIDITVTTIDTILKQILITSIIGIPPFRVRPTSTAPCTGIIIPRAICICQAFFRADAGADAAGAARWPSAPPHARAKAKSNLRHVEGDAPYRSIFPIFMEISL